jgi:methylmalonyl-CoA/ethylmalonyl-CoA epimerase
VRENDVATLSRRVAIYQCGQVGIELIEPYGEGAMARDLGVDRARIEHIAVEVNDVRGALQALSALGVRATAAGVIQVGDRETAWTDPDSSDGVMFQLVANST